MSSVPPLPLSVLDLSPVATGSTPGAALRRSLDLARRAEEWGYARYWVAEHHFAAVASSSPDVLVGLITAGTNSIRVGSAAILVGHRTPVSVVEAAGTVDALYPGRVDVGLGRSAHRVVDPGSRRAASVAATSFPGADPPSFASFVDDVRALLAGTYERDAHALTATPGAGADVDLWILGSSGGESARVAGARGLPFAANYHVSPTTTDDAVAAYRAAFRPSERLDRPYVVVSADVVVADEDEAARRLAAGYGRWVHGILAGDGAQPYLADPDPLTDDEAALVATRVDTQIVGSPATAAARLRELAERTGADELVVTTLTHDHEDRCRSYRLLAGEWGLPALRP